MVIKKMAAIGKRPTTAIFAAAVASSLLFAGLAWACTPAAHIQSSIKVGAPGTRVVLTGENFNPKAPVEIRWNSETGALLATANGPAFSVPIEVPADAKPDVYFLVVLQRQLDANQVQMRFSGKTQMTFQVFGGGASNGTSSATTTGSALWEGFATGSGGLSTNPDAMPSGSHRPPVSMSGLILLAAGTVGICGCLVGLRSRKSRNLSGRR